MNHPLPLNSRRPSGLGGNDDKTLWEQVQPMQSDIGFIAAQVFPLCSYVYWKTRRSWETLA
jgi:hypothetical protein